MSSETIGDTHDRASDTPDGARRKARLLRLNLRYNDMLRSAVDWLWETDSRLNLTYVSPSIATTLGVPAQLLIGRSRLRLFGLEEGEQTAGAWPRPSPRDARSATSTSCSMPAKVSGRDTG